MPRVHPEASDEIRAALSWYARREPSLALNLRAEIVRAFTKLDAHPERYPPYVFGSRRYLLRRFPYAVVYDIQPDGSALVLALTHLSRRPGYWSQRQDPH